MPAVIRRPHFHGGSIRLGPRCFRWHDPYTRSLSFEVERVNVAVIGGLNWKLSFQEYRWIEAAMMVEGLRMAMDRVVKDINGMPVIDANGAPKIRRALLAMPSRHPKAAA
jgi:hypothetical protein